MNIRHFREKEGLIIADLTPKQEKFLVALSSSSSIDEASDRAGIHRSTAYRYLKDDNFNEAKKRLRRETMDVVSGRVQAEAVESLNVLAELRDDPNNPPHSRVQASKILLDTAFRAFELENITERIEYLEEILNKGGAF